jgi:hypothetical protein
VRKIREVEPVEEPALLEMPPTGTGTGPGAGGAPPGVDGPFWATPALAALNWLTVAREVRLAEDPWLQNGVDRAKAS